MREYFPDGFVQLEFMKRSYLIFGLCIGLALGLTVAVGVAWFFKQQQDARQAAVQAAAADAVAKEQAVRFAAREPTAPSPDELDGTWQVVSIRNSQGETTGEALMGLGFQFQGEKVTMLQSKAPANPAAVRVDPFAKPKEIDIIATTAGGREKTRLGIYRIDKGRVFIAMDQKNPARRPKGFVTGPSSGIEVMTLERVP